jgi:Holliday junction DNA helicase RuvA
MIARLHGRLADKEPNRVVVDVAGVGYDVAVPLSTYYTLGEPGSDVALRVHTHVREDTLALYGFSTGLELQIFERLIGISGIGPKLALAVLSGIDVTDLVRAVQTSDVGRLTAIPGIGKKTAERIGLELKDRLPKGLIEETGAGAEPGAPGSALRQDLLSALLNLGYHRPLAEKAVEAALARTDAPAFETVLKQALRELARG